MAIESENKKTSCGTTPLCSRNASRFIFKNFVNHKKKLNLATLKKEIEKKKYIDVGVGVENRMSISRTKLKTAVEKLKNEEELRKMPGTFS